MEMFEMGKKSFKHQREPMIVEMWPSLSTWKINVGARLY